MGMNVGGSKGGARADINVTPLIDIVLVLLIIFMVLTPSMLKHMTANVPQKPNPNDPPPPPGTEPTVLEYRASGDLLINGEAVAPEALVDKITERLKLDRKDKVVFFKVDDEANYGTAVRYMDIVRGAGAKTLGIVTKDETEAAPGAAAPAAGAAPAPAAAPTP
jgi:biopolymer transport protein TolR